MHRALVAAGVFAAAFVVSSTGASGSRPLTAQLAAAPVQAGRSAAFSGRVSEPGATFMLRAVDADGRTSEFGPFTAAADGTVRGIVPASVTKDTRVSADNFYRGTLALETATGEKAGTLTVSAPPADVVLENDFVSSKGWVKPGETYPFTLRVLNYGATPLVGATVTVTPPDGTTLAATSWAVPTVPAKAVDGTPGIALKVIEATADTLAQDPEIAWKNLSATATLTTPAAASTRLPRPEGHPARRAASRPPATATARSRSSPSTTPTARTTRRHHRGQAGEQDQRPRQRRLDVQPLPGDLLRAAVPARDGALGRGRHAPAGHGTLQLHEGRQRRPAR